MEIATMGKIMVAAKIENLHDLYKSEEGTLAPQAVRTVEVADAVVDPGATILSVPKRLVEQLGLKRYRTRRDRTVAGIVEIAICEAVRLTVQGREVTTDVVEVPDECPVLIGQIPLEGLDIVVDPTGQKLIGNPEHGGEQMIEILSAGS
jgi:predicted aspartyl protease